VWSKDMKNLALGSGAYKEEKLGERRRSEF
jgi:hypothetical protein